MAYEWTYKKTGIDQTLVAPNFSEIEQAFRRGMDTTLAQPHWQAVMIGTQTLAVRAAMIQTMLPTLALAYLSSSMALSHAEFSSAFQGTRVIDDLPSHKVSPCRRRHCC